jgi:hypothetical protein
VIPGELPDASDEGANSTRVVIVIRSGVKQAAFEFRAAGAETRRFLENQPDVGQTECDTNARAAANPLRDNGSACIIPDQQPPQISARE